MLLHVSSKPPIMTEITLPVHQSTTDSVLSKELHFSISKLSCSGITVLLYIYYFHWEMWKIDLPGIFT